MTTISSGSTPLQHSESNPATADIFDQPNHVVSPLLNEPLPLASSIPITSERSPFDDEQGVLVDDLHSTAPADTHNQARKDKGKGRARDTEQDGTSFTPTSTSSSSSVRRNDSTLEGDISILAAGSKERDMYLHPDAAEVGRSSSSTSSSKTRHPRDPHEQNLNQHQHQHHQRRTSQKAKQDRRDPRWDLDTMPDKSPSISVNTIGKPVTKEEYLEPRWNGSRRMDQVGSHQQQELGGMGDAGFLGEVGEVDYPLANVEQEEEKRIQDNLASLAAKEAARRRAARSSKAFVTRPTGGFAYNPSQPSPSTLPTTSPSSNTPTPALGSGNGLASRASGWFGSLGAAAGFGRLPEAVEEDSGERRRGAGRSDVHAPYAEPIPQSPIPSPIHGESTINRSASPISRPPSSNPFEPPKTSSSSASRDALRRDPTSPTRPQQPGIDSQPKIRNAEAGPSSRSNLIPRPGNTGMGDSRQTNQESYQANEGYAQIEETGWKGETWRGGAGGQHRHYPSDSMDRTTMDHFSSPTRSEFESSGGRYGYPAAGPSTTLHSRIGPMPVRQVRQGVASRDIRKDKWWYALCSWGNELDDGEDGQGGKTNPFE